jgi:hypothetical protein
MVIDARKKHSQKTGKCYAASKISVIYEAYDGYNNK